MEDNEIQLRMFLWSGKDQSQMVDDFERRIERLEQGNGRVKAIIQSANETTGEAVTREFPEGKPPGVELIVIKIRHEPSADEREAMERGRDPTDEEPDL